MCTECRRASGDFHENIRWSLAANVPTLQLSPPGILPDFAAALSGSLARRAARGRKFQNLLSSGVHV